MRWFGERLGTGMEILLPTSHRIWRGYAVDPTSVPFRPATWLSQQMPTGE